jgi:hypothetical protein
LVDFLFEPIISTTFLTQFKNKHFDGSLDGESGIGQGATAKASGWVDVFQQRFNDA